MIKALFLDRDGTLIQESPGYRKQGDSIRLIPDIGPLLWLWTAKDYQIFTITNQSGINKGLITWEDVRWVQTQLAFQVMLDRSLLAGYQLWDLNHLYCCPHTPEQQCGCRKPKPGLILQAAKDWSIDLSQSVMVGDRETDVDAGINAGVGATHLTNTCSFMEFTKKYLGI